MRIRSRIFGIAAVLAAVTVGSTLLRERVQGESRVTLLDPAKILVVRTPGGMLEVATLVRNEEFAWSSSRVCPLIDCGRLLGATITRIRLPVHYAYRIPLAATWSLQREADAYVLKVPTEEAKVPAAAELSKMEMQTTRGWLSPSTEANRERLLKELQPELDRRAMRPEYVQAQREQARKTLAEFANRWMREQGAKANAQIRVQFADDGPGAS